MKKITLLYFLLFTIINNTSAQQKQNILTRTNQKNVGCQHAYLGAATVTVRNYINNSTHTPYKYVWSNGVTTSGDSTSTVTDLEIGSYSVTITDAQDADFATAEFNISEDFCKMTPVSIFTPNGDGLFETWAISNAQYFPEARILIYNRLGQKVYDHTGLYDVEWDGKDLFGAPLPDSSYYYIIYQDKSDKSTIVKGCVSIVR